MTKTSRRGFFKTLAGISAGIAATCAVKAKPKGILAGSRYGKSVDSPWMRCEWLRAMPNRKGMSENPFQKLPEFKYYEGPNSDVNGMLRYWHVYSRGKAPEILTPAEFVMRINPKHTNRRRVG